MYGQKERDETETFSLEISVILWFIMVWNYTADSHLCSQWEPEPWAVTWFPPPMCSYARIFSFSSHLFQIIHKNVCITIILKFHWLISTLVVGDPKSPPSLVEITPLLLYFEVRSHHLCRILALHSLLYLLCCAIIPRWPSARLYLCQQCCCCTTDLWPP